MSNFLVFYRKFQVVKWSLFVCMFVFVCVCVCSLCVQYLIWRLFVWALRGDQTTAVTISKTFGFIILGIMLLTICL